MPETPMAAPDVNVVFTDPDFGSRMVRVTDADVLVNMGLSNINYLTDSSAEQNTWNTELHQILCDRHRREFPSLLLRSCNDAGHLGSNSRCEERCLASRERHLQPNESQHRIREG